MKRISLTLSLVAACTPVHMAVTQRSCPHPEAALFDLSASTAAFVGGLVQDDAALTVVGMGLVMMSATVYSLSETECQEEP